MKKLLSLITLSYLMTLLIVPAPVLAAGELNIDKPQTVQYTDAGKLVSNAINLIIVVALLLVLVFLIIAGVQWIMSGGDKTAVEAARGRLTAAIIGLVIVLASWAIMNIIGTFFGIGNIFSLPIPKPS